MNKVNIYRSKGIELQSSQLSESSLEKLSIGNVYNDSLTISSTTQINLDLLNPHYLNRIQIRSTGFPTLSTLSFSVSNDGTNYTNLTPINSSYKMTSSLASTATLVDKFVSQSFSVSKNRLYRIINANANFHIYNRTSNSWTTDASDFIPGRGVNIICVPGTDYAYVIPGNGSSDFYRYDLNDFSYELMTPRPIVSPDVTNIVISSVYDSKRNAIFVLSYGDSTAHRGFHVYNIDENQWHSLSNPSVPSFCLFYHPILDRVFLYTISSGLFQTYNMFTNAWSSYETYTIGSPFSSRRKAEAVYSEEHGLVFINTTDGNTSKLRVHAYDPTHELFTGLKVVMNETSLSPVSSSSQDSSLLTLDTANNYFYMQFQNINNITFDFNNEELNAYYYDLPGTSSYRYVRMGINSGSIAEFSVFSEDSAIELDEDVVTYSGSRVGLPGDVREISFVNSQGDSEDCNVYIDPNNSFGSRYFEISKDQEEWKSHCSNNNISEYKCLAGNENFDTSRCGYACSDYSNNPLNVGPVVSGTETNLYVRSHIPKYSTNNVDLETNLLVELLFDD